jgi:hypothetical protein
MDQATPIPARAQVAACVTTKSQIMVYLLDESGARIDKPLTLVALDSARLTRGCDLAWSGSELLVAWGETDNLALLDPSMGVASYQIFAKVVSVGAADSSP